GGEGRCAAEAGEVGDGGLCGGDGRGDGGPLAEGFAATDEQFAQQPWPGGIPDGVAAGAVSGSGPESVAGTGPVRAMVARQARRREHGTGGRGAAVRPAGGGGARPWGGGFSEGGGPG